MNRIAALVTLTLAMLGGPAKDLLPAGMIPMDMVRYRLLEAQTYLTRAADGMGTILHAGRF